MNKSTITIANRQRTKIINSRLLKQIVDELFAELEITATEIEINLVGAKEMAKINWNFLRHEGSTDVITFDYGQKARFARVLAPPNLHGEIFICVDDAISQAKQFKTNWQSEIVHYIVHGILHLLGHDDLKPALRRKMKRKEDSLLRKLSKKFSFAQIARQS
ncbi:MAG TPA: rRNA maturation RNase YbeY [Verrucomicrobiae bacterium]|nr:rRNA maturation RNase YbeY [Verrucomicrobiae bacterium]